MRDQPFGFELAQGLAHRRAADAQFVRQRIAAQPLARREIAVHDAMTQRLIDRIRGRVRCRPVPGEVRATA